MIGKSASWAVFILGAVYAITLILGLISLKSPKDAIGDPFFSVMEILILFIAPLMLISMVELYLQTSAENKIYSLTALVFMIIFTTITCSIHFVILTVSHQLFATGLPLAPQLLAYKWPSLAYTLDILAWDCFFGLSVLFVAPLFNKNRFERTIRLLLVLTSFLCFAGLVGVPLANMQVRMIGVIGYAGVSPVAFLLMGVYFGRSKGSKQLSKNWVQS